MCDEADPKAGRYTDLILILVRHQSSIMFLVLIIGRWTMKELLIAREVHRSFAVQR